MFLACLYDICLAMRGGSVLCPLMYVHSSPPFISHCLVGIVLPALGRYSIPPFRALRTVPKTHIKPQETGILDPFFFFFLFSLQEFSTKVKS